MSKHFKKNKGEAADINSLRNSSCIIATCDAVRGKEATKELVNLLNQVDFNTVPINMTHILLY